MSAAAGEGGAGAPAGTLADARLGPPVGSPPATPPAPSARDRLQREPGRFSLDQACAVLAPGVDPTELNFRTPTRLGAPGGEVALSRGDASALVTPTFGLIGPGGVMPRHHTAWVDGQNRLQSTALHAFVDLLARRFTGLYVKAGAKHRPTRDPRHAEQVLTAAIGLGTPHLADGLGVPLQALLQHAGGLALRTRSAERLRGMLTEETGYAVRLTEFAGTWVRLPPSEQTRLLAGGAHSRLGVDACLGAQVWDPSSRFTVSLGPMPLATFQSLLPDTRRFARLAELTRLQVGLEQDFAFNPVLAPEAVPPLRLQAPAAGAGARLGWTSWLNAPRPRRLPAADARLQPVAPP